ncbi:hypothetical protein [Bacillus cereus]
MRKLTFTIPENITDEQRASFIEYTNFISKKVLNVISNNNSLEFFLDEITEDELEKIKLKIEELLIEINQSKSIKEKIVKSNLEKMVPQNYRSYHTSQSEFYTGEELAVLEALDRRITEIAMKYKAIPRQYKSTLDEEVMKKSGYDNNFPQNVNLIFNIPHDYNNIEGYRNSKDATNLVFSRSFLQPCICYHCYEEWSKAKQISKIITARGNCYRHEVSWKLSKFRKNEFQMREIVFIGTQEEVLILRDRILEDVWLLFEKIGLFGKIVTANDPFFFNDNFKKGVYQKLTDSKYELLFQSREDGYYLYCIF